VVSSLEGSSRGTWQSNMLGELHMGPSLLPSFSPDSLAWPPRAFQGPQLLWLHLLKDLQEVPGNLTCLVKFTWAQGFCSASLRPRASVDQRSYRVALNDGWEGPQVTMPALSHVPWPETPSCGIYSVD